MPNRPLQVSVLMGAEPVHPFDLSVAAWVRRQAEQYAGFTTQVFDLAEYSVPLPCRNSQRRDFPEGVPAHAGLSGALDAADGFIVVAPESTHTAAPSLISAIRWLSGVWAAKPVGLVSYGGVAGGRRAIEHLRLEFAHAHAVSVQQAVTLQHAETSDHNGAPSGPDGQETAVNELLDQLLWWGRALRMARHQHPYAH